jgi:hypothetical protein
VSLTQMGRERLARAIGVGAATREQLAKAFTDEEIEGAVRFINKLKVEVLRKTGGTAAVGEQEKANTKRVLDTMKKTLRSVPDK